MTEDKKDETPEQTVAADPDGVTEVPSTAEEVDAPSEEASDVAESEKLEKDLQLSGGKGRRGSGRRGRVLTALVAVALVLSAALTAALYFSMYRPDQQTDAEARQVALDAASKGTVALLSYSPESLEADFAAAKTHLTGEFLDYYTQFTQTIVTPAAKQKEVKTAASVVGEALAEMHPDSAVALVFVNQTTISKENPDGAFAASSVKVGLTKIDGKWLISTFDPV